MRLTAIKTTHPHYPFVEELFLAAFPESERRPVEAQRLNVDGNARFRCYLLTEDDDERPLGFITVWELDGFYYAEHFAIAPTLRNGGYGSRVMQHLLAQLDRPLVLEVEVPEDELTRRRVAFYERQGFRICDKDYVQPPYRTGGASLPLYLMVAGDASAELPALEDVRKGIYREVYRVDC